MKKYLCDCCGKEIFEKREPLHFSFYKSIDDLNNEKQTRLDLDLCDDCMDKFVNDSKVIASKYAEYKQRVSENDSKNIR